MLEDNDYELGTYEDAQNHYLHTGFTSFQRFILKCDKKIPFLEGLFLFICITCFLCIIVIGGFISLFESLNNANVQYHFEPLAFGIGIVSFSFYASFKSVKESYSSWERSDTTCPRLISDSLKKQLGLDTSEYYTSHIHLVLKEPYTCFSTYAFIGRSAHQFDIKPEQMLWIKNP